MFEAEKAVKWGIIGGVTIFGAYLVYRVLQGQAIIGLPKTVKTAKEAEQTQIVSTSGVTQNYRPRTSYVLGNSGSVREIARLPENHVRGEALSPLWRLWSDQYGSIRPEQVTGTFDGKELGITIPEEIHVTPQLEAYLAQSVRRRTWQSGGYTPVSGTFG